MCGITTPRSLLLRSGHFLCRSRGIRRRRRLPLWCCRFRCCRRLFRGSAFRPVPTLALFRECQLHSAADLGRHQLDRSANLGGDQIDRDRNALVELVLRGELRDGDHAGSVNQLVVEHAAPERLVPSNLFVNACWWVRVGGEENESGTNPKQTLVRQRV